MTALPSGTVTFLFTDIEGSTKLWDTHPEAMGIALRRHDSLIRQSIEQNHGFIFKTIGDAFCAAFHTATDALQATLHAQQALTSEPWPDPIRIKVRMALHTGTAEMRDNDYFGQPLNRVARLLGTGHGEQILISTVTQELVRDVLPPLCTLISLGQHRLRDLNRPETVYQLLHPVLPDCFPSLKSLDNPELPNNLPQQPTSFIGREKEVREIESLLEKTRLLTLTGSGGCGKTRLSLQVAADLLDQFPDGVWLVELASLADPGLVAQTVASVLDLKEQAGKSYVQLFIDQLKTKRLLIVLDNCEHVLSACAQLADALLRNCSGVKILASSREGLGIAGELAYRVPSLSLPDPKQTVTVENVSQYEAVRLFIERALFHLPAFVVTRQNAPALASICHRLDGIPLAIELAAARVRSLSIEEINTRLDNRFRLLTGGSKTALPRQQTLRALIDWSYGLLNEQEKALLCRLSVFAGGWNLTAAEMVGEGEIIENWEVLDLLSSLSDKSLVIAEVQEEATRYRLLETVRQYARDRLAEAEDGMTVRVRHRDYFLMLAEEARPKLREADQARWFQILEDEHDNLRQAITFCLEDEDGGEAGLRIGAALHRFWRIRGHLTEGRDCLRTILEHSGAQQRSTVRADALNAAGALALNQGDYVAAHALLEECLSIAREQSDANVLATTLHLLGIVESEQGHYQQARTWMEESLQIKRDLGDLWGIAAALSGLGNAARIQGELAKARTLLEECLTCFRELGDQLSIAYTLNNLGTVSKEQGDYEAARTLLSESLSRLRELGDTSSVAICLNGLGFVAFEQRDYAAARGFQEECLQVALESGDQETVVSGLEAIAMLDVQEGPIPRAVSLWAVTVTQREALGSLLPPSLREKYDLLIVEARLALDDATFATIWREGSKMALGEAVALACGIASGDSPGSIAVSLETSVAVSVHS